MNKHLFIIGLHRSGTTLLSRIIASSSVKVSSFEKTGVPMDEGQYLQSVFLPDSKTGGAGKFAFNRASYLNERSNLLTEQNTAILKYQWSLYWDANKDVGLEKSPSNLLRTRFLQAIYPDAYFLLIMRHPVVTSYATMKWSNASLITLMQHWVKAHTAFEMDRPFLKKCMVIRYEDFVLNPGKTLSEIGSYLEVDLTGPNLDYIRNESTHYWNRWSKEHAWIKRYIALRWGREFEQFNYTLAPE